MEENKKIIKINLMLTILVFVMIGIIIASLLNSNQIIVEDNFETSEYSTDDIEARNLSEIFYDNGWVKEYISEIKEDVPIPQGYKYVQGTKDTGLIVKDKKNEYYMWIPYEKEAEVKDIDKYYEKVSDQGRSDTDVTNSMHKYGGFYISLSKEKIDYKQLKNIKDKDYNKAKQQIKEENTDDKGINVNLIGKKELEQVLYFKEKNNINFIKLSDNTANSVNITKLSNDGNSPSESDTWYTGLKSVNIEECTITSSEEEYGYTKWEYENMDDQSVKHYFYVPNGFAFEYKLENGVCCLSIASTENPNLRYIWVSVEEYLNEYSIESAANQIRNELLKIFDNYNAENGTDIQYSISDTPTLNKDLEYSLKKFKGFYMAESATKIDEQGNISTNITGTKDYKPDMNGDYIRRKPGQDMEDWMVYINNIAESTLEENDNIISCVTPTTGFEALFVNEGRDNPESIIQNNYAIGAGSMNSNPQNVNIEDVPTIQRSS